MLGTFIAYEGNEIDFSRIERNLHKTGFSVKTYFSNYGKSGKIFFAKNGGGKFLKVLEPYSYFNEDSEIVTVNGCTLSEIVTANIRLYDRYGLLKGRNQEHQITNFLYREYGTQMFQVLANCNISLSTVVYDSKNGDIVAGITTSNGGCVNLFYGYTKKCRELMFSNFKELLFEFCDDVRQMDNNTYMLNGEIYTLDGEKVIDVEEQPIKEQSIKNPSFVKDDQESAEFLIKGLDVFLDKTVENSIKDKIEKNVEQYLSSDDPKKRIEDYLLKELDIETQKQVLEIIKTSINDFNIENNVRESLNNLFEQQLEEYSKKVNIPVVNIIKLKDTELGRTESGFYHEKFEEVLSLVQLDEPIMLIGPAGSGKNHSILQVSQALGLKMYYTNNASNEFKLTGFIDAGGNYRETEFYKAFKNGGVFFLDEIDNSDPSALIVINSALANGYMAFPHETIDRHPDFRMIAAANTWGKGSDLQYVGRNALDGATLDRFDNVFFDYDRKLEESLYPNEEVLRFMWSFREAVEETRILHIVSTRGIGKVYKKEINGIPVETILRTNVIRNLSQDDLNTLLGSMHNVNDSNKFYSTVKTLKLGR